MAKQKHKEQRTPNLSPLSLLRPRLDGLINNPGWLERGNEAIFGDLDVVTRNIPPEQYVPVLLRATANAESNIREGLSALVPNWLAQRNQIGVLGAQVDRGMFGGDELQLGLTWLRNVGVDVTPLLPDAASRFFDAYYGADDLGSQGLLLMFWYVNRHRERVTGFNFLIDFNPPWEGAVKDIMQFPQRRPADALREFVGRWKNQHIELKQIDATEAKRRAIEILEQNRKQQIRLPRDLVAIRDLVVEQVLPLPDGPNTSPFTAADFDALCRQGESADQIARFEQTVGRRVRLEDGQEIFVATGELGDDV